MLKIEYEIKLNEDNRPCIEMAADYENKSEDKFFVIELARYFLQGVYTRRSAEFDKNTSESLDITIRLLGQIGDEMAKIIWDEMTAMAETTMIFNTKYHFSVNTIEERDEIGKYLATENKIFKREEGLKVLVIENQTIYELKDGTENENWVAL